MTSEQGGGLRRPAPDDAYREHLIAYRVLPDGRELHVWTILFGRARLGVIAPPSLGYRDVF